MLIGSPWVQQALALRADLVGFRGWAVGVLSTPAWWASDSAVQAFGPAVRWASLLSALVLLVGILRFVPRAVLAAGTAGGRWYAGVGSGLLTGLASGVTYCAIAGAFAHDLGDAGELWYIVLPHSAVFGVLAGIGVHLMNAGSHSSRTTRKVGGGATRLSRDNSPVALGRRPGDATRYLCAATHTDPTFARSVVDVLLADAFGAVAPSPGVDLAPVALHALEANAMRARRDRWLTVVFAAVLLVAPFGLVWCGLLPGVLFGLARREPHRFGDRGRAGVDGGRGLLRAAVGYVALLAVAVWLAVSLSGSDGAWLLGTYWHGVPLVLTVLVAIPAAHFLAARHALAADAVLRTRLRQGMPAEAAPPPPQAGAWLEARLSAVADAQQGNVTVYSGWDPARGFAGTGERWALSVPVLPVSHPEQDRAARREVTPFDTWELLEHLKGALRGLSGEARGPDGVDLTGLVVEDRVFVHGATIRGDRRFLPHPDAVPLATLDETDVRDIALHTTGTARHSLVAHLPLWGGDVVPCVLLHVATTARTVHVQCDAHVLPPVYGRYHDVDQLPARLTAAHRDRILLGALGDTGGLLWTAPGRLLGHVRFDARRRARERRELQALKEDPEFDYGARSSIRERAVNPVYLNYYQVVDSDRVTRALYRHALSAIREFLEEHGVDTTDFQGQQQTILNNGVIQQGGTSYVGNQAVGEGATANQFRTRGTRGGPPAVPSSPKGGSS